MRKTTTRLLSLLLTAVLLLGAVPIRFDDASGGRLTTQETAVAENPLAAVIADAINKDDAEGSRYGVHRLVLDGLTVAADVTAPDGCTLLTAVFDEESGEMVTSGKTAVDGSTPYVSLSLAKANLPASFIVRAYLLDGNDAPVAEVFEETRYTKAMQEFYALTPADFDAAHVLFAVGDSNFAVVTEKAVMVPSSDTENKVESKNVQAGKYVFSKPSAALKGLKKEDVFCVNLPNDLIVGTVLSVQTEKNGNVTVTTDTTQAPIDLFDCIHIDTDALPDDASGRKNSPKKAPDQNDEYDVLERKTRSAGPLEVNFSVPRDPSEKLLPSDWKETGVKNGSLKTDKSYKEKLTAVFKGTLSMDVSMEYCYHKSLLGKDNYKFEKVTTITYDTSVTLKGSDTLKFSIDFVKLDIPIAAVPGLFVFAQVNLEISLTASVSATGHLILTNTTTRRVVNGEKEAVNKEPEITLSFDAQANVTLSATLKYAVGVEILFGLVKADLYTDLTASVTLTPFSWKIENTLDFSGSTPTLDSTISEEHMRAWKIPEDFKHKISHDCTLCLVGNVKLEGHFGLEIKWNLLDFINTEHYKYERLDEILNEKLVFLTVNLFDSPARVSYINDGWELTWMEKDALCAHAKLLTTVKVIDAADGEPLANVPLLFTDRRVYDEKKDQKGTTKCGNKTVSTDANGEAKIYLPGGEFSLDVNNDDYEIVSSSPANAWFKLTNKPQEFTLTVKKKQPVAVTVIEDGSKKPVAGAKLVCKALDVNTTTDANGKATVKMYPGEVFTFSVTANGITHTTEEIVRKTETVLTIAMPIYTVTAKVTNKYGEAVQGATVKTFDGRTFTTNDNGTVQFPAIGGIQTVTASAGGKSATESFNIVDRSISVNLQLPLGHAVSCTAVDEDGQPMVGIAIGKYGKTDADGKLTVFLDDGDYEITAKSASNTQDTKTIKVKGPKSVKFTLQGVVTWEVKGDTLYFRGNGKITKAFIKSVGKSLLKEKHVVIEEGITSIGSSAFDSCGIKTVKIPSSVKRIDSGAFSWCYNLEEVTLPTTLSSCGGGLFQHCTALKKATLPEGMTTIPGSMFSQCYNLTNCNIPGTVLSIGQSAFEDCNALPSVSLPEGLSGIGSHAFSNCTNLTYIHLPESVSEIGEFAFYQSGIKSISIPKNVSVIHRSTFTRCQILETVSLSTGLKTIEQYAFCQCRSLGEITIPGSVDVIGPYAFNDCSRLKKVTIGNGTKTIKSGAFYYCNILKEVTIPDTVEEIGDYAFRQCFHLESIKLPASLKTLGNEAFWACQTLESVTIPSGVSIIKRATFERCYALKSVQLHSGITEIESNAFGGCAALQSIVIPASVQTIGAGAFNSCENLTDLYYGGTKAQWDAISASSGLPGTCTIHYEASAAKKAPAALSVSTAGSPFAFTASAASKGANYTVKDAVTGDAYILYAVKNDKAADLLGADNLLFVQQKTAESETLSFTVSPKGNAKDYKIVVRHARLGSPAAPAYVPGDVNADGSIGADDARLALRRSVDLEDYPEGSAAFLACDVNRDGSVGADDARLILRASVDLENTSNW
ncbi:MAG: leucine-rich repeat protein [Clostridia bacterium]|nr:leucine-rich repeat protein [Clostridia bacterium]